MNIFISNLNFRVRKEDLIALFQNYGEITGARIIVDKETRRSKGYGFVEMSEEDGMKAIAALNGTEHQGRIINVAVGQEREPKAL
ncbi:MAG: RNA-binding protein [Candidatus Coprenecus sp.]|nr:RNA-binding protein [Candidatus Coprenecus sp.]